MIRIVSNCVFLLIYQLTFAHSNGFPTLINGDHVNIHDEEEIAAIKSRTKGSHVGWMRLRLAWPWIRSIMFDVFTLAKHVKTSVDCKHNYQSDKCSNLKRICWFWTLCDPLVYHGHSTCYNSTVVWLTALPQQLRQNRINPEPTSNKTSTSTNSCRCDESSNSTSTSRRVVTHPTWPHDFFKWFHQSDLGNLISLDSISD